MKEIDTDTLELIPDTTPIPVSTDAEAIEQSVQDIVHIFKNPSKNNIPKVVIGEKIRNAFREIAQILNRDKSTKVLNSSTDNVYNSKGTQNISQSVDIFEKFSNFHGT